MPVVFFLSGYVCSYSLKKKQGISEFYKKRYITIAPAFYPALLVVVLLNMLWSSSHGYAYVGYGNTGLLSVILNLALIHGLVPFCNNNVFPGAWFIGAVWIFYILHPLIMMAFEKIGRKWIVVVVGTVTGIVIPMMVNAFMTGSIYLDKDSFAYYLFVNHILCYALGILCYYRKLESSRISKGKNSVLAVLFLILAVMCFYSDLPIRYSLISPLMGIFSYYFYRTLEEKRFSGKIARSLALIGQNSLSIYIVHSIVVWPWAKALKGLIGTNNELIAFLVLAVPCILITLILTLLFKKLVSVLTSLFSR